MIKVRITDVKPSASRHILTVLHIWQFCVWELTACVPVSKIKQYSCKRKGMICVLNSFPDFMQQWKFTPRIWRLVIYFAYGSVKAWSVSSIVSFSDSMKALLFVSHPDLVTCLFHFQIAWRLCCLSPTRTWWLACFTFRQHESFAVLSLPWLGHLSLSFSDSMKALPFFSHPDLVSRFAHTAKLNFTYYLKHGRPSYAFLSFLTEELEHKTSTLSPKRSVLCGLNYFVAVVVVFRNKYSILLELLQIDLFGLEDNRGINHP